jgi:hypothetical protein
MQFVYLNSCQHPNYAIPNYSVVTMMCVRGFSRCHQVHHKLDTYKNDKSSHLKCT